MNKAPLEIAGQDYADEASFQRRIQVLKRLSGEQRMAFPREMYADPETMRQAIVEQSMFNVIDPISNNGSRAWG